jgi:hypothetical protein
VTDSPQIRGDSLKSEQEAAAMARLRDLFDASPIAPDEMLDNAALYVRRRALTRVVQLHELYQRFLPVHGVILEFGVRWGQSLSLLQSFREMYEPYNHTRRIVGFDTFEGFPSVHAADGTDDVVRVGGHGVSERYEEHLESVLAAHEALTPLSHIRRFELVKGDVTETLPPYLEAHPETIVAFAHFDLDLYEPTRRCLEALRPFLTRGTVLGFDELSHPVFPGETVALREVLGLDRFRIERFPYTSTPGYVVVD